MPEPDAAEDPPAFTVRPLSPGEGRAAALRSWRIELPGGAAWDFSLDEGLVPVRASLMVGAPPRICLPAGLRAALATIEAGADDPGDAPLRRACRALCGAPLDPAAPGAAALLPFTDPAGLDRAGAEALLRAAEAQGAEARDAALRGLPAALTMDAADRQARYDDDEARWAALADALPPADAERPLTLADPQAPRKLSFMQIDGGLAIIATTRDGAPGEDCLFVARHDRALALPLHRFERGAGHCDTAARGHYRSVLQSFGYPLRAPREVGGRGWIYKRRFTHPATFLSAAPWTPAWRHSIAAALRQAPDWPTQHGDGHALLDALGVAEGWGSRQGARAMAEADRPGVSRRALAGAVRRSPKRLLALAQLGDGALTDEVAKLAPEAARHWPAAGIDPGLLKEMDPDLLGEALRPLVAEGLPPTGDPAFWAFVAQSPDIHRRLLQLAPVEAIDAALVEATLEAPEASAFRDLAQGDFQWERFARIRAALEERPSLRERALRALAHGPQKLARALEPSEDELTDMAVAAGVPDFGRHHGADEAAARRIAAAVVNGGPPRILARCVRDWPESVDWPELAPAFAAFAEADKPWNLASLPAAFWRRLTPEQCGALAAAHPEGLVGEWPPLDGPRWAAAMAALRARRPAAAAAALGELSSADFRVRNGGRLGGGTWLGALRAASPQAAESAAALVLEQPVPFAAALAGELAEALCRDLPGGPAHFARLLSHDLPADAAAACARAAPALLAAWPDGDPPAALRRAAVESDPAAVTLLARPTPDDLAAAERGRPGLAALLAAANPGHEALAG